MPRPFLDVLAERVLVCDGAMGTMLYARGIFLNRSFDELNLTQPDLVTEVHQAYARAGADIIETNTFGANQVKLASFGLGDRVRDINLEGARLARRAAGEDAFVAGAIGPLGIRVEPWGKTGLDEAEAWFTAQAAALAEGGVDLFVLETFRDVNELGAAVRAIRSVSRAPVIAQMTTSEDGNSLDGTPPENFVPALEDVGADVVGLNCSVGPAAMLEAVERMSAVAQRPLSAQPNAGRPRDIEGRNIYLCSPEYMASYARRFISNGVKVVGGCCGTTPEHIRQIRAAVRSVTPAVVSRHARSAHPADAPAVTPVPRSEKSRLANALARGTFVVAAAVSPPKGHRPDDLVDQARQLRIRGVDLVQIAAGSRASARMSPLSVAVLLHQQAGVETLLNFTTRDHSLMALQSDLLGAHALGVRNLLLTTGEPPRTGDYQDATSPSDVDSIGLTNAVARLNRGLDIGGKPIGAPTAFHIGVTVNPSAINLDDEVRRFKYKVEAGAEFAVVRPIFTPSDLETFLSRVGDVRIPILAGLRPFESLRQAEFFANEVPGVRVPQRFLDRMRDADQAGRALDEGTLIATELARVFRPMVQGLQVWVASGRADVVTAVVDRIVHAA